MKSQITAGGALLASALLLTACGTAGNGGGGDTGGMPTELGEKEGAVSILAWPGYVEDGSNDPAVDWVSGFEELTGCEVTVKTFGTSDEALNLMKSGEYDVVSASGDASLRLVAAGDVAPVNVDLLENYDGIFDFLKNQSWNSVDGQPYGVPHGYGANLLMWNTDIFPGGLDSWSAVFDDAGQNSGAVTAYDSPIYIADAAVYLMATQPDLGIENPYALDETQLAAAVDLLKAQRQHIGEYWSDYLKEIQAFETGDSVVGTTWQVIQNSITTGNTEVYLPKEGATGWSDTWMISSQSEHPNCAYAWLDWIASPETNATATAYFGEAPSSQEACNFRDDCEAYHAGDAEYASQIWYWSTPIKECLDGRTDVECTDYAQWTAAWQEIKG
ncbi:MAG TPA: extracellular solute-binding protein [Pseudolysinimonas sp.]|nr:extracellular solute-binding protein [Pseudolysinimonas sp.]